MSEIKTLPILPLRDIVVFPHQPVPLFVGREKSVRALEEAMRNEGKQILLATQKDKDDDDPAPGAIYDVGVVATVLQLLKLPDGTVKVLVEALAAIPQSDNPGELADRVASHLSVKIAEKQQLLEIPHVVKRLEKVYALMEGEISVMQTEKKIRNRVKRQMEKTQREYYLNEQMKAIQRELGEQDDQRDELLELEKRVKKTKLSKEARAKAEGELKKLRNMSPMSAESTVVRNYLDWLLSIPWGKAKG